MDSGLDEQQVRDALEEATVDAYGEDEQHTGLLTVIGDELAFPFPAKVMGEVVSVVDMEWPESDEFGLDLEPVQEQMHEFPILLVPRLRLGTH